MKKQEFLDFLTKNQFPEPVLVEQPPNGSLGTHKHDFEVYALVVEGSIEIDVDGIISKYAAHEIFHLEFQQPHKEKYGASGVKYLASRKI
jgi:quercetin dioxygenase-like cupin family protein